MTQQVRDEYVRWVWDEQSRWSQRANDLKAEIGRSRTRILSLIVGAAVLVTASGPVAELSPWVSRIAVVGGVVCGTVASRTRTEADPTRVAEWTRSRSISEGLKSIMYTYLAGVSPYRGADAQDEFEQAVNQLLASGRNLVAGVSTKTPKERDLPAVSNVADYIEQRVEQQRTGYYTKTADIMEAKAERLSRLESGLFYLGALVSAITLIFPGPWLAPWIAVLTTLTTAIAAHAASQRYGALQLEYAQAGHELGRLVSSRRPQADLTPQEVDAQDDRFVAAAEAVISNQNETWMAKSLVSAKAADSALDDALAKAKQDARAAAGKKS